MVSVALAGAGTRTAVNRPPAGADRQVGGGPGLRRAGCAHPAFHREPVAIRRSGSPVSRASLALGGVATAVAVGVGVALLVVVPTPVGRGAPAAALTFTAAPAPAGSTMSAYDAAAQHAFAQVQAAVAASADLKAVPSNLNPPLADASAELNDLFRNGCMRSAWQVTQPDCATGDTASTTTVAVVGDSQATMWNPAFQQVAEQRHWRLEMLTKAGCPLMDLPTDSAQLHREYTECEQWRGQVIARLRAEHPRLVVISMLRGTVAAVIRRDSRHTTRRGSTA